MDKVTKGVISGAVCGAILVASIFGLSYSIKAQYEVPAFRTVSAMVESREQVGDQWNVTFFALNHERYVIEDYATNLGDTIYKLKIFTNETEETYDDRVVEVTQITDLTK